MSPWCSIAAIPGAPRGGRAQPRGLGIIDTSHRTPLLAQTEHSADRQLAKRPPQLDPMLKPTVVGCRNHKGTPCSPPAAAPNWPMRMSLRLTASGRAARRADLCPARSAAQPGRRPDLQNVAQIASWPKFMPILTYRRLCYTATARALSLALNRPRQHIGLLCARSIAPTDRVQLDAGQSGLVRKGTQICHLSAANAGHQALEQPAGHCHRHRSGRGRWADITQVLETDPIEQGAQAVLFNPGSTRLQRTVAMVKLDDLPPTIDQAGAFQAVVDALHASDSSFAALSRRRQHGKLCFLWIKRGTMSLGITQISPSPTCGRRWQSTSPKPPKRSSRA